MTRRSRERVRKLYLPGYYPLHFHLALRGGLHYCCPRGHLVAGGAKVKKGGGSPVCVIHDCRLKLHCKPKPVASPVPMRRVEVETYRGPVCGGCVNFEWKHYSTVGICHADSPIAGRGNRKKYTRMGRAAARCPFYSPRPPKPTDTLVSRV